MLHRLCQLFGLAAKPDAGAEGERLAASWLHEQRGYAVVARNWRNPRDRREEIDLVCRDGEVLVFVEVKARTAGARVPGYYAVNARKKRVLRKAIEGYLARLIRKPHTFRFDVVEIAHDSHGGLPEIMHFENIPLFSKHFRK